MYLNFVSGARFEFVLDEGLKKAASSDDVRDAIADKISRERIGHEVCATWFFDWFHRLSRFCARTHTRTNLYNKLKFCLFSPTLIISLSFDIFLLFLQIDLMVAGNQPVKAMSYVSNLLLFWVVFNTPPNVDPPIPEGHERYIIVIYKKM